jgi:hypothetical protein
VYRTHVRLALAAVAACAATPLLAQVPSTMAPPPQAVAPVTPPRKNTSFQIGGAMTIPAFSYNDFLADIGWQAQAGLILRKGPFNHIRLEGEYNYTAFEQTSLTGGAELYGGGIGGGRVLTKGNMQTETYLTVGGYEHKFAKCAGSTCTDYSEFQFGTKFGVDAVMGRGKVRPVVDFHWLATWSAPYATLFTIGVGLRF